MEDRENHPDGQITDNEEEIAHLFENISERISEYEEEVEVTFTTFSHWSLYFSQLLCTRVFRHTSQKSSTRLLA